MPTYTDAIEGAILGTAVGDSIGLPREGLSRRRAMRMFGGAPLEHRLLPRHGMVSDDTDHTCMAAQSLVSSCGAPDHFAPDLAWRLRWWLLAIPAGIGLATLRSIMKLWLGFPPSRSGVRSAGNGPAMRSAVIGVFARDNPERLRQLVIASTRITHTDPRAEQGAMVIASAAAYGSRVGSGGVGVVACFKQITPVVAADELARNLQLCHEHLDRGSSAEEFCTAIGQDRGVSGFINHTVPVAIFCWLRHRDDFRSAVLCGGDADTVGAIVGALAGATLGSQAIPASWLDGIVEYPWSVTRMRRLARCLSGGISAGRVRVFWPGMLARNVVLATAVILHALRRLLPPC
ncbi:MAG: ADP-ribosylglycohydrolase family protein [Tepidisphaeraceae bacterium]|jgi:ADP-ribosylglycohydrolase